MKHKSNRGKDRDSADEIFALAPRDDPRIYGQTLIKTHNGDAFGPRLIARAIMDIANINFEMAREWGLTDSYLRKVVASTNGQNFRKFIDNANRFFTHHKRPERVPPDIFDRTFRCANEVHAACMPVVPLACGVRPYGAPGPDELLSSRRLQRIRDIQKSLAAFAASRTRHAIFVLTGGPGDGKTTALANALSEGHAANPLQQYSVFISCSEISSRSQIIEHLHRALVPGTDRNETLSQRAMIEDIERALQLKPLVIVFNDFDSLMERTEDGETVVRDQGLFNVLAMLVSAKALCTRILIGATTTPAARDPAALKRLAAQLQVHVEDCEMPALHLEDGFDLIRRNPAASPDAAASYAAMIKKHFTAEDEIPTVVTIAFAAGFALSSHIPRSVTAGRLHVDMWRPTHFEPDEWRSFENSWRGCLNAVRKHDLAAVIKCVLQRAQPQLVDALRLICLSDDGLIPASLHALLESSGVPHADEVVMAISAGALEPLVRKKSLVDSDGSTQTSFEVNRAFRRVIIGAAQADPLLSGRLREANRHIAHMAYRKFRETMAMIIPDQSVALRRAVMYVSHELASLDPQVLGGAQLADPRSKLNQEDYNAMGNRLLRGDLDQGERFCYAQAFLEREILEHGRHPGRPRVSDELILELAMRPLHVGYLFPQETSPLNMKPAAVPLRLPFGGERPFANADDVKRQRWRIARHMAGTVEYVLAKPGEARFDRLPRDWHGLEAWAVDASQRIEQTTGLLEASTLGSMLKQLRSAIQFSTAAGVRDEARCRMEARDLWTLKSFRQLSITALRIDNDGIFESANSAGEELAASFSDREGIVRFKRNRIEWLLRRGKVIAGEKAALELENELHEDLKFRFDRLPQPCAEKDLTGYRFALQLYHKIAGRVADFAAAKGDDRAAFTRYMELTNSSLVAPAGLGTTLAGVSIESIPAERFTGPSVRNFHRFGLRTMQLFSRTPPQAQLREHDLGATLPVDPELFTERELMELSFMIKKMLHQESRLAAKFERDASDAQAAIAVEHAAKCRFNDLAGTDASQPWLLRAEEALDRARVMMRDENVSMVTQLRLLEETARLAWHHVVFYDSAGKGGRDLSKFVRHALLSLDRMIALAEVRNLPTHVLTALLLRAEIVGALIQTSGMERTPRGRLARVVPHQQVSDLMRIYTTALRARDLKRAAELINETGHRQRMVELSILKRRAGTLPCAHLVT